MSKKAWSDAERIQLLMAILESKDSSVDWKNIRVPEGRTSKSCMHILEKLRKEYDSGGGIDSSNTNTSTTPSKRKQAGGGEDEKSDDEGVAKASKKSAQKNKDKSKSTQNIKTETED